MENYIKTKSSNRYDLLKELGKDEIDEPCKFCDVVNKKHVNRLNAEISKPTILIAFTVTLLLAIILLFGYGYIVFIVFVIPAFVAFAEQKKASHFNKTIIK